MNQSTTNYKLYFWLITLSLALVKVIFTLRPEINLFTEEAQYWLWSQNMAWHYYSKPPMVAILNYISTGIFGNTELAVRLNAILCGIGISWITYLFGSYLYSPKVGFWSALVIQAMPVWWLASGFHMTDSSLTFFWALSIYLTYRGIVEEKRSWWIWAGIASALALMAKLMMLFFLPVVFIFLLYAKVWKKQKSNFYLYIGISLLGFIPALIWNWQNDFDTFKHLAALAGAGGNNKGGGFDPSNPLKWFFEYWSGQLAIISVFLLPVWFLAIRQLFREKDQASIYLILPGILIFAVFAILSFVKRVEVNWPIFAYVGLAVVLGNWISMQSGSWKKYSIAAIVLSIGIPVVFLLPDFTGLKSIPAVAKGELNAVRRLSGHQKLAQRIDFLKDSLAVENEFYFSDSYHTASELAFYLPNNPQTYVMNMGSRKNQWDLWADMNQFLGKENVGVFVSENFDSMQDRAAFDELIYEEKFTPHFKGQPIRDVHIEIWQNLTSYNPFVPESY